MKRIKHQKSGISLIVLVITIIVMIILAAAIILSLDGSDIIERAKGAQSSNDVATAKEIVALAKSEWSFEKAEGYDTFREYAESKLEEAGFDMDKTYVEDSGRVLFDTAARFAKAGVEIGTEVTGYTLNNTTSYTTSGKENTCDPEEYTETSAQPATITRDSAIKWTYIGADEDGKAVLAGSVTSTTPKVTLGGKGGYINGPSELDAICDAMYSTAKGTARSMNIDDVTRVLEYTGEKGESDGTPIQKAKTVNEIAAEIGYDMSYLSNESPEEGKDLGTYKADFYLIGKTYDASEYNSTNTKAVNLIYPGTTSTNPTLTTEYWLSSHCVSANFSVDAVEFYVRIVSSEEVSGVPVFDSTSYSLYHECALRPVVVLASDVEISYNGTTVALL